MTGKIFVDEIRPTGRDIKPISIHDRGFAEAYATAVVTNFGTESMVTLNMALANYFVLFMKDCTNDVKNFKFINTKNQTFNSFIVEVHQVDSGTLRTIHWGDIKSVKWGEGIFPALTPSYGAVDIYNFMNRGGYVYLTQENDANRNSDFTGLVSFD